VVRLSRFQTLAGAAGAVVLTIAGVAVAGTADAADAAGEKCAIPLPASVVGDPGVQPGQASGVRVWHDVQGWHVRATHPGTGTEVFTGLIRSPQPISLRGYRLEKQDSVTLADGGRTLRFTLVNHGGVDGVDFTDRCAVNTSFSLLRDGGRLSPTEVYLGAGGSHPAGNPFLVRRHR
jgi:hypothetical protein